jgi:phosphate transport system substrate-binding protein
VREAIKFFAWTYAKGGSMAEELDYVPMPETVVSSIKRAWSEIKDMNGKPIFPVP